MSCDLLATKISDVAERDQLVARAAELSREGCTRGIINDCEVVELGWPERDRRRAYEQLCKIHRGCRRLAAVLEDDGDIEAARSEYERACQYGWFPAQDCLDLALRYLARDFPEPVVGRAHQLLQLACAEFKRSERDAEPACKAPRK